MVNIADLSIYLATPAQVQASRTINYEHWGRGLTLENYLARAQVMDIHEHAAGGNLMTWVLAPRSNPHSLDFLAACETFRRPALVVDAHSKDPMEAIAYGIAAVFCHPRNRGQGYARHMMRLLHHVLATPGFLPPFPSEWGAPPTPPPGVANARFSVLWSDVGPMFYETCGPAPGRVGWKTKDSVATIWSTDTEAHLPSDAHWLSEDDCISLWDTDAQHLEVQLASSQPQSSLSCICLPNRGIAAFQLRRSKFFLPGSPHPALPTKWGVRLSGAASYTPAYATWITDIRPPPSALLITRIRATPASLPALLAAAHCAARENGAATIEVWDLGSHLVEEAQTLGGRTALREEHLDALAWYGPEDHERVEWLYREKFCWC